MRKAAAAVFALAVVTGVVVGGLVSPATGSETAKILDFDTMIGVPRPYTGGANAIRDVPGGGLPWVLDAARGKLRANGRVDIVVDGLVIDPNDAAAIEAGVAGRNPIPNFRAVVSCLSTDAGAATTVNVSTGLFPASAAGDATIGARVGLPDPCIAPIVFVTSPTGAWFAATGL